MSAATVNSALCSSIEKSSLSHWTKAAELEATASSISLTLAALPPLPAP